MLDLMVLPVEMEPLESRVTVVTQALLALLVPRVPLELRALLDRPASRETEERRGLKDPLDLQDLPEPGEWLDLKDLVETRVRPVSLERGDRRDTEVSPVYRVCPDLRVKLETRVPLDLQDPAVPEGPLALLALVVRTVPTVCPAPLGPLALEVALESLVLLVQLVTPDHPALPAPPALVSTCRPSPACPRRRSLRTP